MDSDSRMADLGWGSHHMQPPRRLKALTADELRRLTEARLLAFRRKALSLENSPQESDYEADQIRQLDLRYIWFKSDLRWQPQYDAILQALAAAQASKLR